MKDRKEIKQFFDFYTLSLLNYYAGEGSLNFQNRSWRINEEYEKSVNSFYKLVRACLHYSCIREYRHFFEHFFANDYHLLDDKNYSRLKRNSKDISESFEITPSKEERGKVMRRVFHLADINDMVDAFRMEGGQWEELYGGELWAKAAEFLLEKPKSIKAKELWVDRVLDLHHNCGHILNKTELFSLSFRNQFSNGKRRGKRTALNYRRYCQTISDLALFSSKKTKKLVKANLNFIPAAIR